MLTISRVARHTVDAFVHKRVHGRPVHAAWSTKASMRAYSRPPTSPRLTSGRRLVPRQLGDGEGAVVTRLADRKKHTVDSAKQYI